MEYDLKKDLHSAISLFSKGSFVPGDRIGFEDQLITSRAYNKDGLLLQMGESMKPINEIMKSKARPDLGYLPVGNIDLLQFFGERFGSQDRV